MVPTTVPLRDSENAECARRRHTEKMAAIARLASGLSAELSPLVREASSAVQALLIARPADPDLQQRLDQVRESLQRGAIVLRHLESVSRSEARPVTRVDLHDVIARLRPLFPRLAGPFISISERLDPRGAWAVAELGQLEQLLLTLVVNARDAMPLGGRLTIATSHWCLAHPLPHRHGELPAGEWLALEVTDEGAGMDEETLAHLFEPFFTTKGPGLGSGLGLATAYGMVRQAGGQVIIASAEGAGTTVSICLPAQPQGVPHRSGGDSPAAVLVVDDDEWVRTITSRLLRRAGYGVLEAEHGESALELLRDVAGQCVGTMLADVHMPRLDGRRLAALVRREHPSLRVVLMTADPTQWDQAEAVLRKPFTPGELLAAVQGTASR